jgi:hypothetical protein
VLKAPPGAVGDVCFYMDLALEELYVCDLPRVVLVLPTAVREQFPESHVHPLEDENSRCSCELLIFWGPSC